MRMSISRLLAVIAAVLITIMCMAQNVTVGGRVIDQQGEPMPFVNVVLLTLPDSAYVQGTITDEQGAFSINGNGQLLKVTSIGYETRYVNAAPDVVVTMKEESVMLGVVVVKGQLPKTHVKGDAMRTTVEGTVLEKAGTMADALRCVPSLQAERDGGVTVLGRGEAKVYINGRKVQDMNELSRLQIGRAHV